MNYPIKSFVFAFLIWFLVIFFLTKTFFKESFNMPASLEIEASSLMSQSHEEQKSATKKLTKEKKTHDLSNNNSDKNSANEKIIAIYQPLPAIPDDLRQEAFNSFAIARFYIDKNGAVEKVELIQGASSPRLNLLLLKSLRNWKFSATDKTSTQDIRVTFEVE